MNATTSTSPTTTTPNENNTKTTYQAKNIYAEITQLIIDKMKQGHLVWNQAFQRIPAQNWMTKNAYSGINSLILNFVYGHEVCPYYATIKQINTMKGSVKKGAKGKLIVYYAPFYVQKGQKSINTKAYQQLSFDEQKNWIQKATIKHFYVFNMLDTELCGGFDYDYWNNKENKEIQAEESTLLDNYQAVLAAYTDQPKMSDHRNINGYVPKKDHIYLVPSNRWESVHEYIGTACHELIHSTGHKSRLNRPNLMGNLEFGSEGYAKEELTAEIGAAFLGQQIGSLPKAIDNSAAYLQSWIQVLENDERLIFSASAQAQKAVNWILKK